MCFNNVRPPWPLRCEFVRFHPDGKLTLGQGKHAVGHDTVNIPNSEECIVEDNVFIVTIVDQVNTMNTSEDEPSSGLNGRLRPRKSNTISIPSPVSRSSRKTEYKPIQEKQKKRITSKALPNKPEDFNKCDSSSELQLLCPYCDKTFASRLSASKHVRRTHLSPKREHLFTCLLCNHSEAGPNDIIRHMIDSHPNQYFACLDCHTRFPSTFELAEHKLNVCEKQKPAYRSKLRQKSSSVTRKSKKKLNNDDKSTFSNENKEYTDDHGFSGIVISCELKPSQVHDVVDIEENITTNLILPPSKALGNTGLEKNAVIVLDDIQWNKRIPPNFSFHNTDADQILSRLGVVHRSPRVGESTRRAWFKMIDESSQKFEKCFDTDFYTKVASNVQENLTRFLDGSFNFNPDPELNIIKTRKSKSNVVINTAEGFPILLACDQYSRNLFDGYLPRALAPKHKWKWGNIENADNVVVDPNDIKRDNHVNNCIITLVSSLDIWTQLCMRRRFEDVYKTKSSEKTEKYNIISNELKEILESREIPSTSSQIVKYDKTNVTPREGIDFPSYLGLSPTPPSYEIKPAVLSGEWVRPRCYVCCACGAQTWDSRGLSSHMSSQHPNAQVQHYEIVGEPLLNADIFKHLYVPPNQISNRTRPPRGFRDCTKCKKSVTLEDLHQHMLDCAGDTPAVRRKCRYRPFGVRKRRPRLPDNTIRKKMRKEMRSRHRQKSHLRPKIRSEVGDAETIRKMIADLPAKRHRVVVSSSASVLRPRRKIEKQRKLKIRQQSSLDSKNRKTRGDKQISNKELDVKKNKVDGSNTDEDDKPLKLCTKNKSEDKPTQGEDSSSEMALVRLKEKFQLGLRKNKLNKQSTSTDVDPISNLNQQVSDTPNKPNVNKSEYTARERGDNPGTNHDRNHEQNHKREEDQRGAQGGDGNQNNNELPEANTPLKHSIARLTGNEEPVSESYENPNSAVEKETDQNYLESYNRQQFENEIEATRLDKPPLQDQSKTSCEPTEVNSTSNNSTAKEGNRSKDFKAKKRIKDCIEKLTKKLLPSVKLYQAFRRESEEQPVEETPVDPDPPVIVSRMSTEDKINMAPAQVYSRESIPKYDECQQNENKHCEIDSDTRGHRNSNDDAILTSQECSKPDNQPKSTYPDFEFVQPNTNHNDPVRRHSSRSKQAEYEAQIQVPNQSIPWIGPLQLPEFCTDENMLLMHQNSYAKCLISMAQYQMASVNASLISTLQTSVNSVNLNSQMPYGVTASTSKSVQHKGKINKESIKKSRARKPSRDSKEKEKNEQSWNEVQREQWIGYPLPIPTTLTSDYMTKLTQEFTKQRKHPEESRLLNVQQANNNYITTASPSTEMQSTETSTSPMSSTLNKNVILDTYNSQKQKSSQAKMLSTETHKSELRRLSLDTKSPSNTNDYNSIDGHSRGYPTEVSVRNINDYKQNYSKMTFDQSGSYDAHGRMANVPKIVITDYSSLANNVQNSYREQHNEHNRSSQQVDNNYKRNELMTQSKNEELRHVHTSALDHASKEYADERMSLQFSNQTNISKYALREESIYHEIKRREEQYLDALMMEKFSHDKEIGIGHREFNEPIPNVGQSQSFHQYVPNKNVDAYMYDQGNRMPTDLMEGVSQENIRQTYCDIPEVNNSYGEIEGHTSSAHSISASKSTTDEPLDLSGKYSNKNDSYGTLDLSKKRLNDVVDLRMNSVPDVPDKGNDIYKKYEGNLSIKNPRESIFVNKYNQVHDMQEHSDRHYTATNYLSGNSLPSYSQEIQDLRHVPIDYTKTTDIPSTPVKNISLQVNVNQNSIQEAMRDNLAIQENVAMCKNMESQVANIVSNSGLAMPLQGSIVNANVDNSESSIKSIHNTSKAVKSDKSSATSISGAKVATNDNTTDEQSSCENLINKNQCEKSSSSQNNEISKSNREETENEIEDVGDIKDEETKNADPNGSMPKAIIELVSGMPNRASLLEVLPLCLGKRPAEGSEFSDESDIVRRSSDNSVEDTANDLKVTPKTVTECDTTTSITDKRLTVNTSLYPPSCVLPKKRHSPKPSYMQLAGTHYLEEAHSSSHFNTHSTTEAKPKFKQPDSEPVQRDNLIIDPSTGLLTMRLAQETEKVIPEIKVTDISDDGIRKSQPKESTVMVTEIQHPIKIKSPNDHTSALRSVRIKAPSERKSVASDHLTNSLPDNSKISQIPITLPNNAVDELTAQSQKQNITIVTQNPMLAQNVDSVPCETISNKPICQDNDIQIDEEINHAKPEVEYHADPTQSLSMNTENKTLEIAPSANLKEPSLEAKHLSSLDDICTSFDAIPSSQDISETFTLDSKLKETNQLEETKKIILDTTATSLVNDVPKLDSANEILVDNVKQEPNEDSDDDVSLAVIVRKKLRDQILLSNVDSDMIDFKEKCSEKKKKKIRNKVSKSKRKKYSKAHQKKYHVEDVFTTEDRRNKKSKRTKKKGRKGKRIQFSIKKEIDDNTNNEVDEKIIQNLGANETKDIGNEVASQTHSHEIMDSISKEPIEFNLIQNNDVEVKEPCVVIKNIHAVKIDEETNEYDFPSNNLETVPKTYSENLNFDDHMDKNSKKNQEKITSTYIVPNNDDNCEKMTLLRRSRRKKSLYADNISQNENKIKCNADVTMMDQKSPYTKKQLIFSKLLHDEEKSPENANNADVTETDANNDDVDEAINVKEAAKDYKNKLKTVKRKKSLQTKLKNKKRKCQEKQNIDSSDDPQEKEEQFPDTKNIKHEQVITSFEHVGSDKSKEVSSAEKRKMTLAPTGDSSKPKKTRLNEKFDNERTEDSNIMDIGTLCENNVNEPSSSTSVEEKVKDESKVRIDSETRATCYNRSTQNNLTNYQPPISSKSTGNYDPYDINLENMVEMSDPAIIDSQKTENVLNNEMHQISKQDTLNTPGLEFSFKFNAAIRVSKNEDTLLENASTLQAIDNLSNDSDSSKSDVPLQKYVEAREKKMLNSSEILDNKSIEEGSKLVSSSEGNTCLDSLVAEEERKQSKCAKNIIDADHQTQITTNKKDEIEHGFSQTNLQESTVPLIKTEDNDTYLEQKVDILEEVIKCEKPLKQKKSRRLRSLDESDGCCSEYDKQNSDKFMENFGFFSERKPRKSNLLASKKISETFHMIDNDEDLYIRTKERTSKRSSFHESKKSSEGTGAQKPSQDSLVLCRVKTTNVDSVLHKHKEAANENSTISSTDIGSHSAHETSKSDDITTVNNVDLINDNINKADEKVDYPPIESLLSEPNEAAPASSCTLENDEQSIKCAKTIKKSHKNKVKKPPGYKEKMYPDIEIINLFEDKFDKIKRKCRSQAAAAKQTTYLAENNASKSRKKPEKKTKKKESKKNATVLTKGAMKVFDGIKISIPTQDLNMPPNLSPPRSKKRKGNNSKKKRERIDLDSRRCDSESDIKDNLLDKDVYEFKDNDDTELLELRPSTVMDRFRSLNKEKTKCKDKYKDLSQIEEKHEQNKELKRKSKLRQSHDETVNNALKKNVVIKKEIDVPDESTFMSPKQLHEIDKRQDDDIFKKPSNDIRYLGRRVDTKEKDNYNDAGEDDDDSFDEDKHASVSPIPGPSGFVPDSNEDSSFDWSGSSDADYVYMSDGYGCNCVSDSEDSETEKGCDNNMCLYRKKNVEKNAVMGRIFKNNAVRRDKSIVKPKEPSKPNLDQLFDSLLESNSNDATTQKSTRDKLSLYSPEPSEEIFTTPPMSPENKSAAERSEPVYIEKIKSPRSNQTTSSTHLAHDLKSNNDDTSSDYVFASDFESNNLNKSDGIDQYVMMSSKSIQSEDPEVVMQSAVHIKSVILEQNTNDDDSDPEADDFIVLKRNASTCVTSTQTEAGLERIVHMLTSDDDDIYADCSMDEVVNTPQPGDLTMMSIKSTQTDHKKHKSSKSRPGDLTSSSNPVTEKISNDFLVLKKFVATASKNTQTDLSKIKSKKSSKHDDVITKHNEVVESERKRSKDKPPKHSQISEPKNKDRDVSNSEEDNVLHKKALHADSSKEKFSPYQLSDGDGREYNADVFDWPTLDESGVARQRARRKCTVGKQNVLVEHWSSESEPDLVSPRPNSADSMVAGAGRRKRNKRKDGHQSGSKRANRHGSGKKHEGEGKASSSSRASASSRGVRLDSEEIAGPSRAVPQGPKIRARPTHANYWSSDGEEDTGNQPQHGWIVGDSHKKLVTMLANAKGRKRHNDDKRNLDE